MQLSLKVAEEELARRGMVSPTRRARSPEKDIAGQENYQEMRTMMITYKQKYHEYKEKAKKANSILMRLMGREEVEPSGGRSERKEEHYQPRKTPEMRKTPETRKVLEEHRGLLKKFGLDPEDV